MTELEAITQLRQVGDRATQGPFCLHQLGDDWLILDTKARKEINLAIVKGVDDAAFFVLARNAWKELVDVAEASATVFERLSPTLIELWAKSAVDGKRMKVMSGMPDTIALGEKLKALREVVK